MFSMDEMTSAGWATRRGIRLWEKAGLLGEVARDERNMRRFTADQVRRAKIIGAAQMAGMGLAEIRSASEQHLWRKIDHAQHHLAEVRASIFAELDL